MKPVTATAVNTAAGLETPPLLVTKEPEQFVDGSDPDADEDQPEDDDQDVED